MSLDKLTLDAMVCGNEPDVDSWKALLSEPNRENMWKEAVKRREQIDCFCYLAATWPSLAKAYREIKKLTKAAVQPPALSCLFDIPTDQAFLAAMGSGEGDEKVEHLSLDIPWGGQNIIQLEGPKNLRFQSASTVHIYYQYSHGTGWITSEDSWDFLESEGAVILTFCEVEGRVDEDLKLITQQATSVASVVLMPV